MKKGMAGGFTLIEVVAAVSIFLVLGLSLFRISGENAVNRRDNRLRQQAVWALESQADFLRRLPYREMDEVRLALFSTEIQKAMNHPEIRGHYSVDRVSGSLKKISLSVQWRGARNHPKSWTITMYRAGPQ